MSVHVKAVHRPRGVARALYRLPIWLFHLHLDWLLLNRFVLLTHTGRKSGLARQAVLEVLHADPTGTRYVVLAGWGARADWVQNVEKTPEVVLQIGRRVVPAQARRVSPEEAEVLLLAYARRYPRLMPVLLRALLGYRLDGTENDVRALARQSIVMAFDVLASHPSSSGGRSKRV